MNRTKKKAMTVRDHVGRFDNAEAALKRAGRSMDDSAEETAEWLHHALGMGFKSIGFCATQEDMDALDTLMNHLPAPYRS